MKEACVFDIDGVLLDVSERYSYALRVDPRRGEIFWKIFFAEELLALDKPLGIGIENLYRCIKRNYDVIILSGRPERLREATIKQLGDIGLLEGKEYKKLILRRDSDMRKSYIFKIEVIRNLTRNYIIREIHDDDIEFLRRILQIVSDATLFYYENNNNVRILKRLNYF